MMAETIHSQPPESAPRRPRFTLYLALILLFVCTAFLLVIPTGYIGAAIVFGGLFFCGVIGLHYIVWGRWIDRLIKEEQAKNGD